MDRYVWSRRCPRCGYRPLVLTVRQGHPLELRCIACGQIWWPAERVE